MSIFLDEVCFILFLLQAMALSFDCSMKELSKMTDSELRRARNEVYARRGKIYTSPDLQLYFKSKTWYKEIESNVSITKEDKTCIDRIVPVEKSNRNTKSFVPIDHKISPARIERVIHLEPSVMSESGEELISLL
tara:strand:+ start:274 stop:678 length:405 start_codon:yes stop_codon:yes gene_type:complete